jgi:hypothetical protein
MELAEARELLGACVREELQDHISSDVEVFWSKEYVQIADGHFSDSTANVWFKTAGRPSGACFYGQPALELRYCGTEGAVYRKDGTENAVLDVLPKSVNVFDRGVDLEK